MSKKTLTHDHNSSGGKGKIEAISMQIVNSEPEESEKDRQFVTALARGLEILSCFKIEERYLSNQEIAKRTGLPKPTVSRLTYTLVQLGYLNYSENYGKYYLSNKVLTLGYAFLANMEIRQIARPMMKELAEYAKASVAIGVCDDSEMLYIENTRSDATSFTVRLDVGSHIPLATTAMGRAYLCGVSETERNRLLEKVRSSNEADWQKLKAGLDKALQDYKEKGFCISIGDWEEGINGVAVPFIPDDGSEVFSFNCGAPPFILTQSAMENDIGPRLVALVKSVKHDYLRRH